MTYLSHAYGGKEENKKDAYRIWEKFVLEDDTETHINPIAAFGDLYNLVDYDTGMIMCLELLSVCDRVIVTSKEISEGVKREIAEAERLEIPVDYLYN